MKNVNVDNKSQIKVTKKTIKNNDMEAYKNSSKLLNNQSGILPFVPRNSNHRTILETNMIIPQHPRTKQHSQRKAHNSKLQRTITPNTKSRIKTTNKFAPISPRTETNLHLAEISSQKYKV